jgi:nucleotide-binding universal stress UspA family protein
VPAAADTTMIVGYDGSSRAPPPDEQSAMLERGRALLGSTAEIVVRCAPCDVLVVR